MIKEIRKSMFIMLITLFSSSCNASDDLLNQPDSMIIDHNCTNISKVPVEYIKAAKQKLVIAYGHTSHGSQIISGMDGLDDFMTANGSDDGLFDFNGSGSNGRFSFAIVRFQVPMILVTPTEVPGLLQPENI